MRARNIKPGFFSNEDLAECGPTTRLMFIGLWCLADREGRLENRPKRIAALIFPYDKIGGTEVTRMLLELEGRGFVIQYEIDGHKYLELPNFGKHQRPHHNEVPSTIPTRLVTKVASTSNQGSKQDAPRKEPLRSESLFSESLLSESILDPKKDPSSTRQTEIDPPAQQVIDDWNEMAKTCDLPQPRGLPRNGSARHKALRTRVKEPAWLEDYPAALAKIPQSTFLVGQAQDGGTWKANLDWFLRPDTVSTILEGKYDVAASNGPKPPGERPLQYDPISGRAIKPIELEVNLLPTNITDEKRADIKQRSIEWEKTHWPEEWWDEAQKT